MVELGAPTRALAAPVMAEAGRGPVGRGRDVPFGGVVGDEWR